MRRSASSAVRRPSSVDRAGFLFLLVAAGCGGGTVTGPGPADAVDAGRDTPAFEIPEGCGGVLPVRVVAVDVWGRRPAAWTLSVDVPGENLRTLDQDVELADAPATVEVEATSEGLLAGRATFAIDRTDPLASTATPGDAGTRAAVSVQSPLGCPRVTLYVGLDHPWYAASGRPPREGNRVDLHLDGESFWASASEALAAATREVRGSTWWWQSDFEMVRPEGHETLSDAQRRYNTVLWVLEQVPATKRLLINRFLPDTASGMAYLNSDPEIRAKALAADDGFEVMLQGNATAVPLAGAYAGPAPEWSFPGRLAARPEFAAETFPAIPKVSALGEPLDAASYHQKAFAIDGRVAFVIGMNVKSTDWDTSQHRVFESKRMKFQSTEAERARVQAKLQLPDLGPRKDYGVRIEGPAAADVDDVLRVRWNQALAEHAMYWDHSTPFELLPEDATAAGTVSCQVVATLPPPIQEQSILDTWRRALARAERYIYIEDQYYRMPILNDVILKAMQDRPGLKLIVVTKPVSLTDGGKKYTVESDRLFAAAAPDRYLLLQLKAFDAVSRTAAPEPGDEVAKFYFQDMDTHSKILIVDDVYLSVGSCNKNNRGLLYEGELNVAVVDPAWVAEARGRVFRNLVGPALADQVTDDPDANFALLKRTAEANAEVEAWWQERGLALPPAQVEAEAVAHRPDGFVYPLSFTPDYVLDVGPDAF